MYAEGTLDLMMMVAVAAFKPPEEKEESLASVVKKAKTQHFPVFEKVGCGDPVWPRQWGPGWRSATAGSSDPPGEQGGADIYEGDPPQSPPPGSFPGAQAAGTGGGAYTAQLVPRCPSQAAGMGDSDHPLLLIRVKREILKGRSCVSAVLHLDQNFNKDPQINDL